MADDDDVNVSLVLLTVEKSQVSQGFKDGGGGDDDDDDGKDLTYPILTDE